MSEQLLNGQQLRKKKIITIVAAIFLVLVYTMIFRFSSENAEESSVASEAVMDFFVKLYDWFTGGDNDGSGLMGLQPVPLESSIRKAAHFIEYMAVGFLSFGIAVLWIKKLWHSISLVLIQLVLSGAFDELHQYFVPGRYASIKDVVIDTIGGMAGICIILLVRWCRKLASDRYLSKRTAGKRVARWWKL